MSADWRLEWYGLVWYHLGSVEPGRPPKFYRAVESMTAQIVLPKQICRTFYFLRHLALLANRREFDSIPNSLGF